MQNHPITIHVLPGSLKSTPVLVATELANIPATIKVHSHASIKTPDYLLINPLGKVPAIETKFGHLFESAAILRYIADNSDVLRPEGQKEMAEVDQWVEWVQIDLDNLIGLKAYSILGSTHPRIPIFSKKQFEDEVKEWVKFLDVADKHIKGKEFLVGKKVSIADIFLVTILNHLYKYVFTDKDRKKLTNLTKYFNHLVNGEGFRTVLRPYKESDKEFPKVFSQGAVEEKNAKKAAATKDPKKDVVPKPQISQTQTQAPKPVQSKTEQTPKTNDNIVEEKKKEPEFPATKFDMHSFKTFFVNEPDTEKKMQHLWANFDVNAMSFWHLTYDKLPSECKKLFLTNNLMNGFVDRAAHMRKYVFGVHGVFGEPDNYNIRGVWMGRGVDELPLIKEHDQYDIYKYRKLDHHNEEDRKLITEYFTKKNEDVDVIEGEVLRTFTYVL